MAKKFAQEEHSNEKVLALADFLNVSPEEIEEGDSENDFNAEGGEYMVLTDEEADQRALEDIEQSLWAFNPSFLTGFIDLPEDVIKSIQEKMYEDASPVFLKLLGDQFPNFVEQAISADGRGHFLSGYDGEENEATVGDTWYFIYRTN